MPIVFAQPEPVASIGLIGGGGGGGGGGDSERNALAWASHSLGVAGLEQRQREFEASQMPNDRDQWHAAQQSAMQEQAFQNHMAAMQQQFTWHDQQRLNEMQQAIDHVMNSDVLNDDEKQRAVMLIKTKIDPLVLRRTQSQQEQEQMQTRQMQQEAAHLDAIQNGSDATAAMMLNRRIRPMYNSQILAEVQDDHPQWLYDTPEDRNQAIMQDMTRRGGVQQVYVNRSGDIVPLEWNSQGMTMRRRGQSAEGDIPRPVQDARTVVDHEIRQYSAQLAQFNRDIAAGKRASVPAVPSWFLRDVPAIDRAVTTMGWVNGTGLPTMEDLNRVRNAEILRRARQGGATGATMEHVTQADETGQQPAPPGANDQGRGPGGGADLAAAARDFGLPNPILPPVRQPVQQAGLRGAIANAPAGQQDAARGLVAQIEQLGQPRNREDRVRLRQLLVQLGHMLQENPRNAPNPFNVPAVSDAFDAIGDEMGRGE